MKTFKSDLGRQSQLSNQLRDRLLLIDLAFCRILIFKLSVSFFIIKYSQAADLKDFSHKETKGGKSILRGWRC